MCCRGFTTGEYSGTLKKHAIEVYDHKTYVDTHMTAIPGHAADRNQLKKKKFLYVLRRKEHTFGSRFLF